MAVNHLVAIGMLEKPGVRNLCCVQGLKCYSAFWHEDQLKFYVGVNHLKLAKFLIPYFEGTLKPVLIFIFN